MYNANLFSEEAVELHSPINGLDDLTQHQIDILKEYATYARDSHFGIGSIYDVLLVILGEKPASRKSIIRGVTSNPNSHWFAHLLDKLEIPYVIDSLNWNLFSELDKSSKGEIPPLYGRSYNALEVSIWFSLNPHHLTDVQTGFKSYRDTGELFGHPEEAIEAFEEHDGPLGKDVKELEEEFVENGEFDEEKVKFRELVPYVPPASRTGLEMAYEDGKEYYSALEQFDEYTGTTVGTDIAEDLMNNVVPNTIEEHKAVEERYPGPIGTLGHSGVIYNDNGALTTEYFVILNQWEDPQSDSREYYIRVKSRDGDILGGFRVSHTELLDASHENHLYTSELELLRERNWLMCQPSFEGRQKPW